MRFLLSVICLLSSIGAHATVFPLIDIYNHLDVTTFRSSLMPARTDNEKHFSEFDTVATPLFTENKIIMEDDEWFYSIEVKKSVDLGIYTCFTDKAKQGTYSSKSSLLLRKYGKEYIALHFAIEACNK
ncbi:hypothetical protein [Photobacterium nomapromontoriensis]|uniref:hypothetical protein n=1 Tax=Photobacterium nomapromontoriensis TaxID=2910237 RepID=UPI003D11DEBB